MAIAPGTASTIAPGPSEGIRRLGKLISLHRQSLSPKLLNALLKRIRAIRLAVNRCTAGFTEHGTSRKGSGKSEKSGLVHGNNHSKKNRKMNQRIERSY
jgi:hypothetical protein